MKQKLFTIVFLFLFVATFGYFYGEEYQEFYHQKQELLQQQERISIALQEFSSESLAQIQEVDFAFTPDKGVLDRLVQKIDASKHRVYLEVYIFTEKRILESLKKAHQRGIDVRVVLEKNPYKAPRLNDERYLILQKMGIPVVWSNTKNYSLNHAKFFIIDDEVIISTGNASYSTFTKNRDFFIFLRDDEILKTLESVFLSDFSGEVSAPYHENIVLSPQYSRQKITKLFQQATESLDIYFQYLKDDELLGVLVQKSQEGVKIRIVIDDGYFEEYTEEISYLETQGIEIHKYVKPSMHAKAILADKKTLFIGSVNFSTYSLDANREVGIILQNKKIIEQFLEVFSSDF